MSEWISVEDRLQEAKGFYLTYGDNKYGRLEVGFFDLEYWHSVFVVVEFWMPLPDPPVEIT